MPLGVMISARGNQARFHRLYQRGIGQVAAAGGLDHRIGDQGNARPGLGKRHQNVDDIGGAKGSGLDGVDWDIGGHALELAADQFRRHRLRLVNIAGVLYGQAGHHRQGVAAQGRDGLDVRLDAGAAGGVQSRQDKYVGAGVASDGHTP